MGFYTSSIHSRVCREKTSGSTYNCPSSALVSHQFALMVCDGLILLFWRHLASNDLILPIPTFLLLFSTFFPLPKFPPPPPLPLSLMTQPFNSSWTTSFFFLIKTTELSHLSPSHNIIHHNILVKYNKYLRDSAQLWGVYSNSELSFR